MRREPKILEEWKSTLVAASGLVIVSFVAWYGLSRLSETTAGDKIGTVTTVLLMIWLVSQTWYYMT